MVPDMGRPAGPTFEQLHGAQLEGDAVFLGEDVDGTAGLGQQVQVELQAHGEDGTGDVNGPRSLAEAVASAGENGSNSALVDLSWTFFYLDSDP